MPFSDAKILIIGAGMAGVAAGKKLYDSGYTNFQIIEATDRIGGRVRNVPLGKSQVEIGAMWIYGKGSNPVYTLAQKYNLSFTEEFLDEWTVINDKGEDVTDAADEAYELLEEKFESYTEFGADARAMDKNDFSLRAGMRHMGWNPQTAVEDAVDAYLIDFESGIDPVACSGKYYNANLIFADFGDSNYLIVNDPAGFSKIIKRLAAPMKDKKDRFIFNKKVTEIQYYDDGVSVNTTDGTVYNADYALVTVSLGVLQQRLIKFTPPLPEWKLLVIDEFGIAEFSHIYVKYNTSFWDNTMYVLYTTKLRGQLSIWLNMNTILPGSNILQVSLFDQFSRWADLSSDAEILEEITNTFKKMYPAKTIPSPVAHKISRWNSDPLYRGAFSYWPPGFTTADMEQLGQNVGRVYFAGEHTHPLHFGFVHGAFMTGESTAEELMSCINDTLTCDLGYLGDSASSMTFINMWGLTFISLIIGLV